MARTVTIERPAKKDLGDIAVVAIERNPKNGKITNQEWWSMREFSQLVAEQVEGSEEVYSMEIYVARDVPRWMRWILGQPTKVFSRDSRPLTAAGKLSIAIKDRLREDRNRTVKK
jgi:hypothetical protein